MGDKQTISSLVTGGEASAGPPLGPALGPMGVNIMEVIKAINDKTNDFKGMKVPVTVSVDAAEGVYDYIRYPYSFKQWSNRINEAIHIAKEKKRFYGEVEDYLKEDYGFNFSITNNQYNKMKDPYEVYNGDLEKWARECMWWGRRTDRMFV